MSHNNQNEEKRRFTRINFDATVLLTNDGEEWTTELHDISLNGLLTDRPNNWEGVAGERFGLEIIFAESGALINGEITVAHVEDGCVGFRIITIDVDSVAHLKRLIELNMADADLLDRELASLHWK